jgi:hypothetical protein
MTSDVFTDEEVSEEGPSGSSLSWEVPEIAGISLLAVTALLASGGLATGIARSVTLPSAPFASSSQLTWNAVQFGAQWASPVIAVFLLGVLGLCWYQLQVWSELLDTPGSEGDEEVSDAHGHIERAGRMARWAVMALGVTAAGSLAGFVAEVGANAGQSASIVVTDIYAGASMLAVFLLLAAGFWVDRQVASRSVSVSVSVT